MLPGSSAVSESKPSRSFSSMDLQVAVLRHLPTPILVLSPHRTTVFVNRAAERILGSGDPIQPPEKGVLGRAPVDLGIKLLYNRKWDVVLARLAAAHDQAVLEGNDGPVDEFDAVVSTPGLSFAERHFQVLVSILTADDGVYFMLSFERSPHIEKSLNPRYDDQLPTTEGVLAKLEPTDRDIPECWRDIPKIKKAVFDSCNVAGFILTKDEQFYLTNKKAREVLEDLMGGTDGCDGLSLRTTLEIWDEHFEKQLEPSEFPGMRLVQAKKPFTGYRCGLIHAMTGDRLVMSVDGECLYDDDTGEFMGGICWCRDLQVYSDFLVDQQQRRLQSHETICNFMPHLVWTTTTDGLCDWFSDRWYEFTGLTKEESVGVGFQVAIHPEDLPKLLDSWKYHRIEGKECDMEVRYRRHDGNYRWMLARAWPLRGEDGKILKWYGTNTDIHDLVMARIEAARNKLQVLTVLAHAEVNLFSINKDKIITMAEGGMRWNANTNVYDVNNKSSLIGQDAIVIAQSTQPGGIPGYEKNILAILDGKVGVAQSEDLIGGRVYRTRVVAELEHNTVDGGQEPAVKGALVLSIDVTDMKARTALELDNARLMMKEQAAKDSNQMKSQFLANMSHELRTPTAGVIGMVELLSDDETLTAEQREYVSSIHLSAKALLTIVNDILDFSKIESGRLDIEKVPFNLSSTVGELCKLLAMFADQKGLEFVYDNFMDEDLEVIGDPGRTRQVLSNLLTNALKFTKQGSVKLTVTSTLIEPDESGQDTIKVQFLIEDTGIGIEQSVLDKLFKPFSQGDSSTARLYGGTGLGLTISKNLATLMDGSIHLESQPNVGSKATFIIPFKMSARHRDPRIDECSSSPIPGIRLAPLTKVPSWTTPLIHRSINQDLLNQQISSSVTASYHPPSGTSSWHGSADSNLPPVSQLSSEQRSQTHILVVEDNPINQTIAIKNIRKLGFPVTAVWNGREALSYLLSPSTTQPRPSIILMDVQMPVMDGYEATRILRSGTEYAREEDEAVVFATSEGDRRPELDSSGYKGKSKVLSPVDEDEAGESKQQCSQNIETEKVMRVRSRGYLRDIPVIAMTASAIQGDREKCHDAGMDDYLAKPVEKARLEEMLLKWVERKRNPAAE
ncbi:M4WV, histidine kinase-group IX protein [Rhexocercosporidium sp. MPI-PUGE-AT-0058]|nr:M4WV, histidine kinase-group IX protein [Rhexocercosporidium sp. MPI-PUGE-AT-0058]